LTPAEVLSFWTEQAALLAETGLFGRQGAGRDGHPLDAGTLTRTLDPAVVEGAKTR